MTRSRKEKRQHNDSAPEQRARIFKSGMYDGSNSSRDFVVSGHSTGSANTEMEALSHQVSIDAGRVPDYQGHDYMPDLKSRGFDAASDLGVDMVSPEFYGPKPRFTGSGTLQAPKSLARRVLSGTIRGAGAGALAYLAYRFYEQYKLRKAAEPIFDYIT